MVVHKYQFIFFEKIVSWSKNMRFSAKLYSWSEKVKGFVIENNRKI